ncbi:MAG: hypothetical protein ACREMF_09145 [Gemmatimonadales bacterium]
MADLRPMEFGEILDGALSLFRRHFGLFFKLSLAVMWLPIALLVYWRVRFLGFGSSPEQAAAMSAMLQSEIVPFFLWLLVWGLVYTAAMLLLTAGSIRIISDSYLGREPQFGEALALGVDKIVPLFLVGFGKSLLLALLMVLCAVVIAVTAVLGRTLGAGLAVLAIFAEVIGACWLVLFVASGYMVTTPVVVLETLPSAFDSFGRSWELTRSRKRRVFGLVLVAWLIANVLPALVLQAIGALILQFAPGAVFPWTIVSVALPVVLAPVVPCVLTLAYYDLRVRREGFDLQLLGEQLGVA